MHSKESIQPSGSDQAKPNEHPERSRETNDAEGFFQKLRKEIPLAPLALAFLIPVGTSNLEAGQGESIPEHFSEVVHNISPESAKALVDGFGSEGLEFLYRYLPDAANNPSYGLAFKAVEGKPEIGRLKSTYKGKEAEVSSDTLKKITIETLPKGWIEGSITSINQDSEIYDGTTGAYFDPLSRKIQFTAYASDLSIDFLVNEALLHESCHPQDWKFNNNLTAQERANFLLRIMNRMNAEDAYVPDYSKILPGNSQESRASEYWADICSQYFRDLHKLPEEDRKIVKEVIDKVDPDFDATQKALQRKDLIAEAVRAQGAMANIF